MPMRAEKQGDFALRRTNNYFDLVDGNHYHLTPITFHEFLTKPESLFIYDDDFMQVPGYIQRSADIAPIEEGARQFVVGYIMDEFSHNLLGMQDYLRWADLFRNLCASITPAFWSQVNMHDLMLAHELEMDANTISRTNTGNASRVGGQTTTTEQAAKSATTGRTSTVQDVDNMQSTDTSSREANATVVRAADQLSNDIDYNWSDAADNVREVRSRAGDAKQHMESATDSESSTASQSNSVSTSSMNNSADQNTNTGVENQELTNKMFMQERQWAIDTARQLLPLQWLRQQLRPMFYLLY